MTDIVDPARRSEMMGRIRAKDSAAELAVRSALHALGYRFRLHVRSLPGKPDVVLAQYQTVIRVQGCFWHRHPGCRLTYSPKSRVEFWNDKFASNVERDERQATGLREKGWHVVDVWECEATNPDVLHTVLQERFRHHGIGGKLGSESRMANDT